VSNRRGKFPGPVHDCRRCNRRSAGDDGGNIGKEVSKRSGALVAGGGGGGGFRLSMEKVRLNLGCFQTKFYLSGKRCKGGGEKGKRAISKILIIDLK